MILIKNGKILTMENETIQNGYVLIDQGKIIKVGQDVDDINDIVKGKDIKVVDVKGKYVLPGLVDSHCHVGLWEDSVGFEGEDGNEMTDPITPHLKAIDGIYHADRAFEEAREHGVTTVVTGPGSANVLGGQFAAVKTWGRRIEEMVLKEPVAIKAAFGENPKAVYSEKRQSPSTRMATAALLRENLIKAKEYKQLWKEYHKDTQENDKPDFDMKMDALLKVLNKEIPLKCHAHRADDILTAIRIAKEFDINLTIEHCTEGHLIKDILSEEGIGAVVGPSLTDRSKIELRNQSLKTPAELVNAGIKVAIMTDHPCTPIQHLILCAAMSVREGMDENEALKSITINAAKLTGVDDRVGSIKEGKDADIVIYDGYPLEFKTKVDMTIINGKVVYERE